MVPGYTLAMSDEIRNWLADLGRADRPAAEEVGRALIALAAGGDSVGPPLVTSVVPGADRSRTPADRAAEALDLRAEDLLEQARQARQRLAAAAETGDQDAELAELVLRAQRRAEAFRHRRSVLTARYAAAQAELAVAEAELAGSQAAIQAGQVGSPGPGPADRGGGDRGGGDRGGAAGPVAADLGVAVEAARRNLAGVVDDMEREAGGNGRGRDLLQLRLLQLRPGGAAGGVRIIFAVEPPGTALVISVVETADGAGADLAPAIDVSVSVLEAARAGSDPDAAAVTVANLRSVLGLLALD